MSRPWISSILISSIDFDFGFHTKSISDGWSGPILLNDVHNYYHELSVGNDLQIQEDESYLKTQEYIQRHKSLANIYWQERLSGIEVNDLSVLLDTDKNINEIKSLTDNYQETLVIKGDTYNKLKSITAKLGITTNTLLQFAWHKLINIYTQNPQTIVGTTVSGRDILVEGIENSVGLYINTLPLVIDWGNTHTIKEQLEYVHSCINDMNRYSYADLSKIQSSKERLFHSLFVFENE